MVFQLLNHLTKDRVTALMIDVAVIHELHRPSSADIYFWLPTFANALELLVNHGIDHRCQRQVLAHKVHV